MRIGKYIMGLGIAAAATFSACSSEPVGEKSVELTNTSDSLSYAIGLYMSQEMQQIAFDQLGVDRAYIDEFARGIRDAFPDNDDKKTLAYTNGLHIGSRAVAMMEQAQKALYGNDSTKRVDRELFIEAVIASVYGEGKTMSAKDGVAYYNRYKYRGESEKFMTTNATREGVVTLPSGLQYKMEKMGEGDTATPLDTVSCIYRGTFTNGRTFDSSRGLRAKLTISKAIPGLVEALCTLPEGSKGKIYVPWQLGYGAEGNEYIPPYSTLVFDIEIVKVLKNKH